MKESHQHTLLHSHIYFEWFKHSFFHRKHFLSKISPFTFFSQFYSHPFFIDEFSLWQNIRRPVKRNKSLEIFGPDVVYFNSRRRETLSGNGSYCILVSTLSNEAQDIYSNWLNINYLLLRNKLLRYPRDISMARQSALVVVVIIWIQITGYIYTLRRTLVAFNSLCKEQRGLMAAVAVSRRVKIRVGWTQPFTLSQDTQNFLFPLGQSFMASKLKVLWLLIASMVQECVL